MLFIVQFGKEVSEVDMSSTVKLSTVNLLLVVLEELISSLLERSHMWLKIYSHIRHKSILLWRYHIRLIQS